MVANVRCEDIKNDQLAAFTADQAWAALVADADAGLVRDFGQRVAGLKDSCIDGCGALATGIRGYYMHDTLYTLTICGFPLPSRTHSVYGTVHRYEQEAMYFHSSVRDAKRMELEEGLVEVLATPFGAQMRHLVDRELVRVLRKRTSSACLNGWKPCRPFMCLGTVHIPLASCA